MKDLFIFGIIVVILGALMPTPFATFIMFTIGIILVAYSLFKDDNYPTGS